MSNKYLEYFYSRGLSDQTIEDFRLGYCDSVGNCTPPAYQPFVDFRFYNSVLFPITDLYNNVVAVASRAIDTKSYIHSKYTKKRHMFGLGTTYPYILKERKVYVVEGNFDLLTLYEKGIKNAVAMLGSKLSISQISLLTRFAEEIIIATDGDKPGQECASKMIKQLKENNILYKQLHLPDGSDPDSFVREHGTDAFNSLVSPDLLTRTRNL